MNYWLMKSEPSEFSIDDLKTRPKQTEHWDGVRNYQARNFMRDQMQKGDQIFFYHSNCEEPGIVGIAEVVKEAYPDHSAFDPKDKHYDPKSDKNNPRWFMVDVKFVKKFRHTISLKDIKDNPILSEMKLVQKGNRLSVLPITKQEWSTILKMEK
ncbi:MAG: EVE domain-containing protein [Gammaproteobacteria bacterium]|nr:EVE domain-containing protein [Gammaproteobacteria bacterium]